MVRIKLIVTGAAAAALGLAVLGTPGVAGAVKAPPVTAQGQIECSISTGKATIKPGLLDQEPFPPGVIRIKGTLSGCTTVGGGPAPSGITGGKITGTLPMTESPCSGEVNDENVGATFKIKWKGTQKVVDTSMSPTETSFSGQLSPSTGIPGFSLIVPGTGADSGGYSTGSFSTTNTQVLTIHSPTDTTAGCTPKTKGVRGSGGLKKVTIGIAADDGVHSLAERSSTIRFGVL
jgi:hypothetical protein